MTIKPTLFASPLLLLRLNVGNKERGFLTQYEEEMTRRTGGAQGIADEVMRQKDCSTFLYLNAGVIYPIIFSGLETRWNFAQLLQNFNQLLQYRAGKK